MTTLPAFPQFLQSSRSEQSAVLSLLFEPCEALQFLIFQDVLNSQSFASYPEFIETVRKVLLHLLSSSSQIPDSKIPAIIAAHPRLGAKKVESKLSKAEQATLVDNQAETVILNGLNKTYEETFPGLRYVVFVNGRTRPVIFEDMKRRMARNNYKLECDEAFNVSAKLNL